METNNNPVLDFSALASLSEEERTAVISAYMAEVEAKATAVAEEKYSGELRDAKYSSVKYKLACEGTLCGFAERIEAIESIAAENPALASLPDEEKLRTAYYIDRGMRSDETPSTESLLMQLKNNPEAMRLCEAAILEKLKCECIPSLKATSGTASVPLTPQKKPKSIDEASTLARAAFGI